MAPATAPTPAPRKSPVSVVCPLMAPDIVPTVAPPTVPRKFKGKQGDIFRIRFKRSNLCLESKRKSGEKLIHSFIQEGKNRNAGESKKLA